MRPSRAARNLLGIALLTGLAPASAKAQSESALAHYQLGKRPTWNAELPKTLAEISGMAYTADGKLLVHGDERAIIWELDPARGAITSTFGFTHRGRIVAGDFEDILVVGDRIFLLSSSGDILEGRAPPDGQAVEAERRGPGLGGTCEAEGLAWDQATRSLLVLCKQVQSRRWRHQVVILAILTDSWKFESKPRLAIPERDLERFTGTKGFHGSALARHPRTGTFLLVAGPERAYAEVSPSGKVLGGGRLDHDFHRQPEGIAVAPDQTVLISDEAAGKRAMISGYAYQP